MAAVAQVRTTDQVCEQVKQFILDQGLGPGDLLPGEFELAEQLGISRPSVREAMRRLQALDIVEVRRGRGSFVGNLSLSPLVEALGFRSLVNQGDNFSTLREVVQLRHSLDRGIADHLCTALQGSQHTALEILVEAMVQKAEAGEVFAREDFAFHDGLLALSGNEIMRQLVASLWKVHVWTLPKLGLPTATDLLATARAHGDILSAVTQGDTGAYLKAIDAHYSPILRALQA